jgi:hypothetical protein
VITYYTNQIWYVNSVTLFVPEKEIELFDNTRIVIKNENLLINWKGTINNKSENEVMFNCD